MSKSTGVPDVIALIKERDSRKVEVASTAAEQRKVFQSAPGIVECVLGPVGGPYKPAMYSADANMFMPKFKEE